jgi:hypothetical protein
MLSQAPALCTFITRHSSLDDCQHARYEKNGKRGLETSLAGAFHQSLIVTVPANDELESAI